MHYECKNKHYPYFTLRRDEQALYAKNLRRVPCSFFDRFVIKYFHPVAFRISGSGDL